MANARVFVPGIKASSGSVGFAPLVPGTYTMECKGVSIDDPKNPQPAKNWKFKWDVIDGPVQENGKPAKRFQNLLYIMLESHPDFNPEDDRNVDELKSIVLATGVAISKDDGLNPDSFAGTRVTVDITQYVSKKDGKIYNGTQNWRAAH